MSSPVESEIKTSHNRIWFLQMLRGIACLVVFLFHVMVMFWVANDVVQVLCYTPAVNGCPAFITVLEQGLKTIKLNLGAFGVGLFFLISGFVIPISLEKQGTRTFLIQRFFRIYPTYWVGLSITILLLVASATFNHKPLLFSMKDVLLNATLSLRDWFVSPRLDGINWTLEIEIAFYVLMAIFSRFFTTQKFKHLAWLPPFFLGLSLLSHSEYVGLVLCFINFMLIGTGFLNLYKKQFTFMWFMLYLTLTLGCFAATFLLDPQLSTNMGLIGSYLYALGSFSLFYAFRNHIMYNPILDFISTISYPLYIVHGFNSYVIMSFLYQVIPNYWVCTGAGLFFSLSAAILLHYLAEKPSLKLGKRIHG
ncbi:MAG: acyltransferase [Candidatus Melainabacteria bacterium]|nr:acyltransferase [Candidatus Melainabacteria bacterium]